VERPGVPTDAHRFELAIKVAERDGTLSNNYIDYWKAGHVAPEAKTSQTAVGANDEVRSGRRCDSFGAPCAPRR
jgi:hypothetical protein